MSSELQVDGAEAVGLMLELAAHEEYHRALDIASGDGAAALALAAIARQVVAVPTSPTLLPGSRDAEAGGAAIELTLASPFCLPFADRSFDLVTCRVAAQHFHRVRPALDEVVRVMTPGGIFVLADALHDREEWIGGEEPSAPPDLDGAPRHYPPASWCRLLEEHGLLVDTTVTTLSDPVINRRSRPQTAAAITGSIGATVRPRVEQKCGAGRDASLRRFLWAGVVVRARKP